MSDDLRSKLEAAITLGAGTPIKERWEPIFDDAVRVSAAHYEPQLEALRAENEALRELIRSAANPCDRPDGCCSHSYHLSPPSLREPSKSLLASVLSPSKPEKEEP